MKQIYPIVALLLLLRLVKYPASYVDPAKRTKVATYYNYWIAANFAAQEDLLPVSDNILKYQTSMLSGSEFWWKDEMMGGEWGPMFTVLKRPATGGLSVQIRPGFKGNKTGYSNRTVYLDVDVTPKIEVVVSDLTPGGAWSLRVRTPTTVQTMANCGAISVGYQDSRFRWKKEFFLTTYPTTATVTNCDSAAEWTASNGASVTMERDMIKVTPQTVRTRSDWIGSGRAVVNTGRVTFPLKQIDFSCKPILKITVPDHNGSGTTIGLLNAKGVWKKCAEISEGTSSIDLGTATKWDGSQEVTLTLDPVTRFGSLVRIRNIKVGYPKSVFL